MTYLLMKVNKNEILYVNNLYETILEFSFQNHRTLIFALSTESSFCPAQAREADVMFLLVKVNKNEMMCKYLV